MGKSISIKNYNKSIKNNKILNNINLTLESGKVYGLKGRNGSGKSMLMRAMSGMMFPDSGEVIINKINITKEKKVYDNIGVLIENAGFIDYLNGYDNLKLLANIKNIITDSEIKEWMIKFNLDPDNKTKVRGYSLGMRQKLGIIQALMEKPEILFLDEPINALDEESIRIFNAEIKKIKSEDKIVVISNHNYEELKELCDEIIEIESGTIKKIYSV